MIEFLIKRKFEKENVKIKKISNLNSVSRLHEKYIEVLDI